jgi:hypothetical protein
VRLRRGKAVEGGSRIDGSVFIIGKLKMKGRKLKEPYAFVEDAGGLAVECAPGHVAGGSVGSDEVVWVYKKMRGSARKPHTSLRKPRRDRILKYFTNAVAWPLAIPQKLIGVQDHLQKEQTSQAQTRAWACRGVRAANADRLIIA